MYVQRSRRFASTVSGAVLRHGVLVAVILVLLAGTGATSAAQEPPTLQPVGGPVTRSEAVFLNVSHVLEMSDGAVLVVDSGGTRLTLLDTALAFQREIVYAAERPVYPYSRGLMSWSGDSALFLGTPRGPAYVIDPSGNVARQIRIPPGLIGLCLMGGNPGTPAVHPAGGIVCQMRPGTHHAEADSGVFAIPRLSDTSALVRVELESPVVDTLALLRSSRTRLVAAEYGPGQFGIAPLLNPIPDGDDWALLASGVLALVRGGDYHVDFLRTDGSVTSSPPIPFTPAFLSADRKAAIVDSVELRLRTLQGVPLRGALVPRLRDPGQGPIRRSELTSLVIIGAQVATAPEAVARGSGRQLPPLFVMQPEELPDMHPPFRTGTVRADRENRLWIGTPEPAATGAIYHVIDERGELVSRVVVPEGRTIVGFGLDGALYMAVNEFGSAYLERATFRPDA